jgi:MFS family permease
VLALGATGAQVGLMSSLASLGPALLLLPAVAIIERQKSRKVVVVFGATLFRLTLLLLALLPLVLGGIAAVYTAIALAVLHSTFANLTVPAWMPLTADIVPVAWRGRYFSARGMSMVVASTLMTLAVGQLITGMPSPAGYQIAMGLSFVVGMASTYAFWRIDESVAPSVDPSKSAAPRPSTWKLLRDQPLFVTLCAGAALWNFSVNLGGPFFNVYLVERLGATASVVGILSVVASLAALPGHRLFGPLADRWGPQRVLVLTGLLIPLLPFAWLVVRAPWQVAPIHVIGGFLWAGYGIAAFNTQLFFTPEERRARYTAVYQVVILLALSAGAGIGSIVADRWGYKTAFAATGFGRLAATLFYLLLVRPPKVQPYGTVISGHAATDVVECAGV